MRNQCLMPATNFYFRARNLMLFVSEMFFNLGVVTDGTIQRYKDLGRANLTSVQMLLNHFSDENFQCASNILKVIWFYVCSTAQWSHANAI